MSLVLVVTMVLAVSSTLAWVGFYVGIRALPGTRARQSRWIVGSVVVAAAWLVGVLMLGGAASNVLRARIPVALAGTMLVGYLLLLSPTFRRIIAAVPEHWLIAIQVFRILGGLWLVRYSAGALPGLFALPAGIGDVLTGLLAPFIAYACYSGKPYARSAAIAWNLFGMADLVNAVVLATLTGAGAGIVFPLALIPAYGVPRSLLIHSYSLVGLLSKTSQQPRPVASLRYRIDAATIDAVSAENSPSMLSAAPTVGRDGTAAVSEGL